MADKKQKEKRQLRKYLKHKKEKRKDVTVAVESLSIKGTGR
jgi:hypothetical protein